MSVMIENTDELLTVLKKLGLKVSSVDELRHLLATINANYNPEVARQKTGKLIGVTVPGYMAGAAAFVSFFLVGGGMTSYTVGGLALIWGACAAVSVAAVIAGAILTGPHRRPAPIDRPADRPVTTSEQVMSAIGRDLSL